MRPHRLAVTALLLASSLVAACSGTSESTSTPAATEPPEPTANVREQDLERMVLPLDAYGATAAGFIVDSTASGITDNAESIEDFTALTVTEADITARGRLSGYRLTFADTELQPGPFGAISSVELFSSPEAASAFLEFLYLEDTRAAIGLEDDGIIITSAPEFAIDGIGDRAGGVRLEMEVVGADVPMTYTIGYVQYGRLLGVVGIAALDYEDRELEVRALLATLNDRVRGVVAGRSQTRALEGPFDGSRDAAADIEAALSLASGDGRRVLLDFGANWCPDCIVLDELLNDVRVREQLDSGFHLVRVDAGFFDRNLDVAERYMPRLEGISTLVVLEPDGTTVTVADEFADARYMTADDVMRFLSRWTPATVAVR